MQFMNDFDIDSAIIRFSNNGTPNRYAAAIYLDRLATWADTHSDGWAHWPKPARAATKLMALAYPVTNADITHMTSVDATDAELKAALRPVKAFLTRQGFSSGAVTHPEPAVW